MVRKYTFAFLCIAAAVCGCNKEEAPSEPVSTRHTVTLHANAAGNETKNIFDDGGNFYWLPSDAIGLATVSGDGKTTFSELKRDNEAVAKSDSFSGEIEGSAGKYAVYPYNAAHALSGTTLTYNLPDSYTYNAIDADFYSTGGTSYINSSNAPAYGVIAGDGSNLSTEFKHLGGVLSIKLDKIPATNGHISIIADRQITGNFSVNLNDSCPQIKTSDEANASSTENTVTINWVGATVGKSGVFYFPMPVGTFNVRVEVGYHSINSGEMARVSISRNLVIKRALMKKISLTYATMAKDSYYIYGGHKFIDLGLPSGLLWAETNVGAKDCYAPGGYYAWGEFDTKDNYGETSPDDKYTSNGAVLDKDDDAAYKNWGIYCRMPSMTDWKELHENCSMDSEAYGRTYTGKTNGNSIYLYAGGFGIDNKINSVGHYGYYWARDLAYAPDYPNAFVFGSASDDSSYTRIEFENEADAKSRHDYRYKGFSIRPVVSIDDIGY